MVPFLAALAVKRRSVTVDKRLDLVDRYALRSNRLSL